MRFNIPVRWELLLITCLCIASTDSLILSISKLLTALPDLFRSCWGLVKDLSSKPFSFRQSENIILEKLNVLTKSIEALGINMLETSDNEVWKIVDIMTDQMNKEDQKRNNLKQYVETINTAFRNFLEYSENRNGTSQSTVTNFTMSVVSPGTDSVISLIERIHLYIVTPIRSGNPDDPKKLFLPKIILQLAKQGTCRRQQSLQQMLYSFYNDLVLLEIKAYTMVQFSNMVLSLYRNDTANYTTKSNMYSRRFMQRSANTLKVMKPEIMQASRDVRRCNPETHVENETFIQITGFLQGYIENEVDLNKDGFCHKDCATYTDTKSYSCYQDLFCSKQRRCKGKIHNCKFVTSDMRVCQPKNKDDPRRYEYVEYDNGLVHGRKVHCEYGESIVSSWYRKSHHCSYCMCLCETEENNFNDRYISLQEVTSDVLNNKVITGIRFIKVGRIIHLQVQQGELQMDGMIVNNTVEWVPVKAMAVTFVPMGPDRKDYYTATPDYNSIALDDLTGIKGYVLTGVKLQHYGWHVCLMIRTTPFNFTTGKLLNPLKRSIWRSGYKPYSTRTKVKLENPDVPTRATSLSTVVSGSNSYVHFTHTGFDEDAAQTTVPFFDAQPVISKTPVPLSGAGIYYKGQTHYGGFIAPKIITYDYTPHLKIGNQSDLKIN